MFAARNSAAGLSPLLRTHDFAAVNVLLVTDRPFMRPVDGSSHTYLMWLHVLRELGHAVSVLSFSRFSQPWTDTDAGALRAVTRSVLLLPAHPSRAVAAGVAALTVAWRGVAGRRFLPVAAERIVRRQARMEVAAFLDEGAFDAVIVNKLHTTSLVGRDLLRDLPARKLIDMHDNYPANEQNTRRVLLELARSNRQFLRPVAQSFLRTAGWAGEARLLREEARLLGSFDHVVFNAREEADAYAKAGVPRMHISVLPLPRPPSREMPGAGSRRPFDLGLVASASVFNIQGLAWLAREVLPRLRSRAVRLLVAGNVGRFARNVLPAGDAEVLGWVDDIGAVYAQVEVVVVPLLTGTGVSVKTMEAADHGAAIVSTTIGARGVTLVPGRDFVVADGDADFARAVGMLLDDKVLRASLRSNARRALHELHSRDVFAAGVEALLRPAGASAQP